ncbi:MAG TPA: glycerol kinase GlpK [Bryobacteraceae bacterium]|nr:glycerol kinase GlpK [Bryobacteraceae bacterium]
MRYLLALDEGTTSSRAAVYGDHGRRLAMHGIPLPSAYPHPGWVEQDANDIWRCQLEAARQALFAAPGPMAALGITNQRETTVVWDRRTGQPVAPAVVWQCRRTADACARISGAHGPQITECTGLVVDAYFSASKIRWLLDNVEDGQARAEAGDLLFGTVDTWLVWKLTGGAIHVTDETNASRTMLMNLESALWDSGLLALFNVPQAMLPRIAASSEVVGTTSGDVLGVEIPIAGIAGDQQAALAGQACFRPGLCKNTYGTGCFALMHTGSARPVSNNRLLSTRAARTGATPAYAIEGSIFIAGAAVQWLRDRLNVISTAAESEAVARSVADTGGVYLVPAFTGLGTPYWDPAARGTLTGMTLGTSREHIVRATLESIAYQTRDLIDSMERDTGSELQELRVDGGASANDFLMQFQADILGRRIARPADTETTALGAACLAGLAAGIWKGTDELEELWQRDRVFEPAMRESDRNRLYEGWQQAVRQARLSNSGAAAKSKSALPLEQHHAGGN